MQVQRARFALFDIADTRRVVLGDTIEVRAEPAEIVALALLTGRRERLTREEFDALLRVPAGETIDAGEIGEELARSLVSRGLLVDEASLARVDALLDSGWNLYAAGYHFMTRREDVDLRVNPDHDEWSQVGNPEMRRWVELHGPAPPPYHDPVPEAPRTPLPRVSRAGGLFDALARRRTTRTFAVDVPMRLEDLATIASWVFGARGEAETDLGVTIKRTSPSGGSRHPIEAYALVSGVDGLAPGIYHYDVRANALARLEALEAGEVRELATTFACGQGYLGDAHVSFVLTARFERGYWKYRRRDVGYAAVLMDAGHLSQTLYLLAAELGLGAWVTLAVNARAIEARLGLDGVREGVLAMSGCGVPTGERSPIDMPFRQGIERL
ncbi:putative peptide maturation dehydrogenase [Solirubrobacter soli]|uniref:putative peptide maturation dehydrogenase n=1 Tax=Solirubrobacter soli TaxID=363832 RepID=UPI00040EC44E|nr:putative peptide maturation dehydrogenase [Solirubrobacter soli]